MHGLLTQLAYRSVNLVPKLVATLTALAADGFSVHNRKNALWSDKPSWLTRKIKHRQWINTAGEVIGKILNFPGRGHPVYLHNAAMLAIWAASNGVVWGGTPLRDSIRSINPAILFGSPISLRARNSNSLTRRCKLSGEQSIVGNHSHCGKWSSKTCFQIFLVVLNILLDRHSGHS